MLAAHLVRGAIVGVIALLAAIDAASIPALAVLGVLFGAADALYMPAQQAFLPRTVSSDRLPSANALLQGTLQLSAIVGPPAAGVLIAIAGTSAAFTVDAVSFAVAAVFVALISTAARAATTGPVESVGAVPEAGSSRAAASPAPAAQPPEGFRAALMGGLRYVAADPAIRTMMLISFVLNFSFNGPGAIGAPWLASQRFAAGPTGLGLMEAGWAVGALIGILAAGSVRLDRQGRVILAGLAVSGSAMALVGVLYWLPGVIVMLAVMGVAIGYTNIIAMSWLQARVDPAMVGRVMGLVMLMSFGITPLSIGVAGALVDVNATAMFVGSGVLVLLTTVGALAVRFPELFDAPAPILERAQGAA
jgi:MFS family permease